MNRSGLFLLVTAIIIAVTTIWINSTWINLKYFQLIKKEKQIDYYLSNFTLINIRDDGQMRYLVTGKHLIHQQTTGASEIFNPVLEARNFDNTITFISAKKAIQEKKSGNIKLEGLVQIKKEASEALSNGFNIQTSDLTYNPFNKELFSNTKISFESADASLQGIGFSSKFDEQELRILSNVQAKYQPHK